MLKVHNSLKKSVNKKFKTETLEAKYKYVTALHNKIESTLIEKESYIPEPKLRFFIEASREAAFEIKALIKQKLRENQALENRRSVTMAPPSDPPAAASKPFDIKTATALIKNYDGLPSELDTFVDSADLLSELT